MANERNLLIKEAEKLKMDGQHTEAIAHCEKILYTDLHCGEAYEEIGDNYLSLREYDKAKKALKQAIKINARSANANYLLGFLYSAIGDFNRSIKYLEIADGYETNHPEILRCLGWSLYHDGQRQRGIVLLERALALSPQDSLILSDLGVCYLNSKKFNRAGQLFKNILQIEPNNEKAKECLNAVRFFKHEYKKLKERDNI
ncbi:tetratricopeptide repeat protein [Candidatus Peregrinibacteria bacterium]|nr:tetratricopeptide repeat protein [Candidatus Peregrinibacteria bacterium]